MRREYRKGSTLRQARRFYVASFVTILSHLSQPQTPLKAHFNKPLLFNYPYHNQRTQSPIRPLRNWKKGNNRPKGVLLCIASPAAPVVIDRKDRPRGAEDGFSFIAARGCSGYPIVKTERKGTTSGESRRWPNDTK